MVSDSAAAKTSYHKDAKETISGRDLPFFVFGTTGQQMHKLPQYRPHEMTSNILPQNA